MKKYNQYVNYQNLSVDVPGISPEMAEALEERIAEFEEKHLTDAISGGDGWVPKIKTRDIAIAAVVNAIILIYYVWAIVS